MSITHDQNFKNLILDYPLQALQLFAASEAPSSTDKVEITPIRQEQLKDRLPARQYFHATNIVARILLPLMRHAKQERARVYGHSVQGLLTLEPDPELQRKYLDLIDSALPLTDNERQQYERAFPREQSIMATLSERWKAEGIRQGLAQGEQAGRYQMLAHLLEKRFGVLDPDTVSRLAGASTAELDQWAERTLDAGSLQEVFEVH